MKIDSLTSCATLNNGTKMPWLGLGTYLTPPGSVAEQSCKWSFEAGYRHIDTAAFYKNEENVGRSVRESGVPRKDIFITTKCWNDDMRAGTVAEALDKSLRLLGTGYVDLYLLHWPVKGKYLDCWRMMEEVYKTGKARAIGVSNFLVHHVEDILRVAKVVPAVNQVEWHPLAPQKPLVDFCQKKGIIFEAWAPLIQGKVGEIRELVDIGRRLKKSPAQVAIRWGLQHDVVMIPKSVKKERIIENAQVFDFELTPEDMQRIDAIDKNQRVGPDPDNFSF